MNSVSMATNCAPFCRAQKAATASLSVIRLIAQGYTIESAGAEAPRPLPQPEPPEGGFGAPQGQAQFGPYRYGIPGLILWRTGDRPIPMAQENRRRNDQSRHICRQRR